MAKGKGIPKTRKRKSKDSVKRKTLIEKNLKKMILLPSGLVDSYIGIPGMRLFDVISFMINIDDKTNFEELIRVYNKINELGKFDDKQCTISIDELTSVQRSIIFSEIEKSSLELRMIPIGEIKFLKV